MDDATRETLRRLPSVEELLQTEQSAALGTRYARERLVESLRRAVDSSRERIIAGAARLEWDTLVSAEHLLSETSAFLEEESRPHLRRVVNASGVVIHTNLGRSVLAPAAVERVVEVARHYNNLEYRLDEGVRGSRHEHVEALLCRLSGAQAAMVVNNNAAAVLLTLSALAAGREVVVGRGQLVEIGGSFRVPDIMRQSGARLVEVGTTNKTRLEDYETALSPDTALLLRVHTSNFKVVGFSEEVGVEELVELGRREGLPVADDLGSGSLLELPPHWDEPSVFSGVRAGADVVMFSGDKLLGGPQAGILVGESDTITRLKRHPLARALRVDKMTLAALEGTLLLYLDPDRARREIPTLRYLHRPPEETRRLAEDLAAALSQRLDAAEGDIGMTVEETTGKSGGGALPLVQLPSHAVTLKPARGDVVDLERALREAPVPVVARISEDTLHLDTIALDPGEIEAVAESVVWALGRSAAGEDHA